MQHLAIPDLMEMKMKIVASCMDTSLCTGSTILYKLITLLRESWTPILDFLCVLPLTELPHLKYYSKLLLLLLFSVFFSYLLLQQLCAALNSVINKLETVTTKNLEMLWWTVMQIIVVIILP